MGVESGIQVSNQSGPLEAAEGDHYSKKKLPPLGNPPRLTRGPVDRMLFLDECRDPRRLAKNILRKIREFRQLQT